MYLEDGISTKCFSNAAYLRIMVCFVIVYVLGFFYHPKLYIHKQIVKMKFAKGGCTIYLCTLFVA